MKLHEHLAQRRKKINVLDVVFILTIHQVRGVLADDQMQTLCFPSRVELEPCIQIITWKHPLSKCAGIITHSFRSRGDSNPQILAAQWRSKIFDLLSMSISETQYQWRLMLSRRIQREVAELRE